MKDIAAALSFGAIYTRSRLYGFLSYVGLLSLHRYLEMSHSKTFNSRSVYIEFYQEDFRRLIMENFPWDEFYERFVLNYEEFMFYYKGKELHISTGGYGGKVYIAYGNKNIGYVIKEYDSPLAF